MRRERITLVGTPTVIAPRAIPLLGDFALPGEELAVLAALSSHATAQYIPDEASNSPLLSAVTELTRAYLGETAAALPPGAVLLRPPAAGSVMGGRGDLKDLAPSVANGLSNRLED